MARPPMNDEDRDRRRSAFLLAARELFRAEGELPGVGEIAARAGLAKGTVYLYFGSKEELFVALLEEDFARLFEALGVLLGCLPAAAVLAAGHFAKGYAAKILESADLLALANGVLEHNVAPAVLRRFKLLLAQGLDAAGARIETRITGLAPGTGSTLLLRTYALTLGLWQALDYPKAVLALLAEPQLAPLARRFTAELESAVRALWVGSLQEGAKAAADGTPPGDEVASH